MDKINVEDFLDFCIAQGGKCIQHYDPNPGHPDYRLFSVWSCCAVGEYYTHLTGERLPAREADDSDSFPLRMEHALDALGDEGTAIFDALGNYETSSYPELVGLLRDAGAAA